MTEGVKVHVVFEYLGGLRTAAAANNVTAVASALRSAPGVGKPFLAFPQLTGPATMAFWDHPSVAEPDANGDMKCKYIVTNDVAANAAMINEMLANPPTDAVVIRS